MHYNHSWNIYVKLYFLLSRIPGRCNSGNWLFGNSKHYKMNQGNTVAVMFDALEIIPVE